MRSSVSASRATSAPSDSARSRFSGVLAVAITRPAPSAFASCTARLPTPPAAAWMTTDSPGSHARGVVQQQPRRRALHDECQCRHVVDSIRNIEHLPRVGDRALGIPTAVDQGDDPPTVARCGRRPRRRAPVAAAWATGTSSLPDACRRSSHPRAPPRRALGRGRALVRDLGGNERIRPAELCDDNGAHGSSLPRSQHGTPARRHRSPAGNTLTGMDSTLACLATWMPRQRWYAAKGRPPSLRLVSWWDLPPASDEDADARIRTFLVADEGALPVVLYQIPVVSRATETVDAAPDHIIGSPEPGTTFIDGPFDPAYARALIRLVTRGGEGRGPRTIANGHPTRHVAAGRAADRERHDRRAVQHLADLPLAPACPSSARSTGSCIRVSTPTSSCRRRSPTRDRRTCRARSAGSTASGRTSPTAQGTVTGSLAAAQEFLPDVDDAWRVALQAAARAEDFRERGTRPRRGDRRRPRRARRALPDPRCARRGPRRTPQRRGSGDWRSRSPRCRPSPIGAARSKPSTPTRSRSSGRALQRIHGDYHLGQVLQAPEQRMGAAGLRGRAAAPDGRAHAGRPRAARRRGHAPVVRLRRRARSASMTRSARPRRCASGRATRDTRSSTATRSAPARISTPLRPLLAALELDKAVYEAIYEARNRPTWVVDPAARDRAARRATRARRLTRTRIRRPRRRARPRPSSSSSSSSVASARAYQASHSAMRRPIAAWNRSVAAPGVVSPK